MIKILHIDIETVPTLAYVWKLHDENIGVEQIVKPSTVLCFSAKWHGSKELLFYSSRKDGFPQMIRAAHKLLNEADAVCHYNGVSFDIPVLNQEFLRLRLPPPAPSSQIDLYQVVRRKFRLVSSKLAFVGPYLKIGEKVKHQGFELWLGCMNKDKDCWELMEKYNREDTVLVERLYTRILPWIERHPNVALFIPDNAERPLCVNCGSARLKSEGLRRASTYTYRRFHCLECGKWSRERFSLRAAGKPLVTGI